MYFNPIALLVLAAFFGLVMLALSAGSDATRAAEAAVTVLIALGVGGFLLRGGQRRAADSSRPHEVEVTLNPRSGSR